MTRLVLNKHLLLFLFFFALCIKAHTAPPQEQPIKVLVIFDVSKSMIAQYESGTRMEAAKNMAYTIIDSLSMKSNLQIALRAYGASVPYPPGNCTDSKLIFNFEPANGSKIKEYISTLRPTGITPIAYSLEQAIGDFKDPNSKNFIIIITDGIEECGGNICQVAIKLREKNIVLRPFIVGIGLSEEQSREFECVGTYFDANKENTFSRLSNIIITQILNPTSAQVNLLDKSGKPSETNIAMILYDLKDKLPEYSYIHTLDRAGNPDTLYLDVYRKYSVAVNTIPMVKIDTAEQALGKHNTFAVDAAQGELNLRITSPIPGSEPMCIIRKKGELETLNFQKFNTSLKYLCGEYDLEIMTTPRILMPNVNIPPQGKVLEIPACGQLQIRTARKIIGAVLMDINGEQVLIESLPSEGITSYNIFLQPGKYTLVYRNFDDKSALSTNRKPFTVGARNFVSLAL